jgi:hypothetical protein
MGVNMRSLKCFLLALAVGVTTCIEAQTDVSLASPSAIAPTDAPASESPYYRMLLMATVDATRILAAAKDPLFSDAERVAVQMLPHAPLSVAVLFPTDRIFPTYRNLLNSTPGSPCLAAPFSSRGAPKIIVCNPDAIRTLDVLIRLAHGEAPDVPFRNDWELMQTLDRASRDPGGVVRQHPLLPQVSEAHIQGHLMFVMTILLAHESWHLRHGASLSFAAELSDTAVPELRNKLFCRNWQEFGRGGLTLGFDETPVPLTQEGTTDDPALRKLFARTRSIWLDELAADEYSADVLKSLICFLAEAGTSPNSLDDLVSQITQSFEQIMMVMWFRALQPFASKNCADFAGQDFFLSRCLCNNRHLYDEVGALFAATHPPIILRMFRAAMRFAVGVMEEDGIDLLSDRNSYVKMTRESLAVLKAMLDVPMKLTVTGCHLLENPNILAIINILPDRAGFSGPNASNTYPGYPADESQFALNCVKKPEESTQPLDKTPPR